MPQNEIKQSIILNWMLVPLASAVSYLHIDIEKISILAVLMTLDMLTGFIKAWMLAQDITSRRLLAGFLSKIMVLLVPFSVALMAKGIGIEMCNFIVFCISILIVAEAYSVIGNVHTIKTGKEVREIDAISAIVKYIGKTLESMLRVEK